MKIPFLATFFLILSIAFCNAQDAVKMQQQLKSLMSKEKQADLDKQEEQKLLFEKQKLQLLEQEKVVLKLQFDQKRVAIEHEKNEALSLIQKNRLKAQFDAAIKDKRISDQQKSITNSRRLMYYLITISIFIVLIAIFIYVNNQKTKRLNRLVISQHQELERVGLIKDRLFNVVGHDLRSPFNMLISLSSLLKQGNVSPDKMIRYMDQLESTLKHTSSLMDNLLNWAESQMQGYKPQISFQNINNIVNSAIIPHLGRALEKNINIINSLPDNILAICDKDMLSIVLRNLISNAIKFTPKGGGINILAVEADGKLTLIVEDNGIGLSDENIQRFNSTAFHPTESTIGTEKEKGTGLGLMLCKTYTQLMNGEITVDKNDQSTGCIFKIILPNAKLVA